MQISLTKGTPEGHDAEGHSQQRSRGLLRAGRCRQQPRVPDDVDVPHGLHDRHRGAVRRSGGHHLRRHQGVGRCGRPGRRQHGRQGQHQVGAPAAVDPVGLHPTGHHAGAVVQHPRRPDPDSGVRLGAPARRGLPARVLLREHPLRLAVGGDDAELARPLAPVGCPVDRLGRHRRGPVGGHLAPVQGHRRPADGRGPASGRRAPAPRAARTRSCRSSASAARASAARSAARSSRRSATRRPSRPASRPRPPTRASPPRPAPW